MNILRYYCIVVCVSLAPLLSASEAQSTPKNVLVLKSDGAHVLTIARILSKLEEATQVPIYKSFDMIAGSSMGGVLGLYLAQGHTAKEFLDHMESKLGALFSRRGQFRRAFGANIFSTAKFEQGLKELFGQSSMHSLQIPTLIAAPEQGYQNKSSLFFSKQDEDFPLWQIARATTAHEKVFHPISFKVKDVTHTFTCAAGNNQLITLAALETAQEYFQNQQLTMVKMATGEHFSQESIEELADRNVSRSLQERFFDIEVRLDQGSSLYKPSEHFDFALQYAEHSARQKQIKKLMHVGEIMGSRHKEPEEEDEDDLL